LWFVDVQLDDDDDDDDDDEWCQTEFSCSHPQHLQQHQTMNIPMMTHIEVLLSSLMISDNG